MTGVRPCVRARIVDVFRSGSIGNYAFGVCESFTSITIPNSVTSIGVGVFYYCISLTSINVVESNRYYSSINGVLFSGDSTRLICYPAGRQDASYDIPNSVTSIGDLAFCYCKFIVSITIPNSVVSIGSAAFGFCESLISISIPNSVLRIGIVAFRDCTALASITIPNSVTSIGKYAFGGCESLTSIDIGYCIGIDSDAFPNHRFYDEDGDRSIDVGSDGFIGHKFRGDVITKMIRNDSPDVKHRVIYITDGGSLPAPTQTDVEEGKTFKAASYSGTKTGYTFRGWSCGGTTYDPGDSVKMGTSDMVMIAIWKEDGGIPGSNGDQTVLIIAVVVVLVALAAAAYWFVRHK